MKKKMLFVCMLIGIISIGTYSFFTSQRLVKDEKTLQLLMEVESLTQNETDWGCAGNPTWVPNESLQSDICISGGTHLKCKSKQNVCCDPSQQTDCPPIKIR